MNARKLVSLVTLAQFLACSSVPMQRATVEEPRKEAASSTAQRPEPATTSKQGPAAVADEVPAIREAKPEHPPLVTGPAPSSPATAAALAAVPLTATPLVPTPAATALLKEYQAKGSDTGSDKSYRLGEDDELEISVYQDPDLIKTQNVRPDGKIAFPLVGDTQAVGLTPDELRLALTRELARYVKNPLVTVVVKKFNAKKISVLGEVKTPGQLGLSYEINLVEAISRVGGLSENADLQGAVLVRDGQAVPVDFDRLFRKGDLSQNALLKANDIVLIPDIRDKKVFVLGQVDKPLVVSVKPNVTLVELMSRAGGVTENADLQGALLVREGQVLPVDFEKLLRQGDVTQNVLLKPNDVVFVPDIRDKKVFVLGQVDKPLVVSLKPNVTLVEAVSRAGGVTENADLQGALLVRNGQPLPVNFDKLFRQGDFSQNVVLQPNDVVLIPNLKDKKIFVLGEVSKPVAVQAKPGIRLAEAITSAGGFSLDAQKKSVVIVRGGLGDPKVMAVNFNKITEPDGIDANVPLEAGDIVYVPRSFVADLVRFMNTMSSLLTPLILAETGIALGPTVRGVLTGTATGTSPTTSVGVTSTGR